jgi:hypothetical protein
MRTHTSNVAGQDLDGIAPRRETHKALIEIGSEKNPAVHGCRSEKGGDTHDADAAAVSGEEGYLDDGGVGHFGFEVSRPEEEEDEEDDGCGE